MTKPPPRLGINDFLIYAWEITEGWGFDFDMVSDQWWGLRFECLCSICDPKHTEHGKIFYQTSVGPLDVEETLYKLQQKLKDEHE